MSDVQSSGLAVPKPPDQPMAEQTARVVQGNAGDAYALVEVIGGGCGRCHETGGCGSAHLTQMFCLQPRRYRVRNDIGAVVGAVVTVALPTGNLRRHVTLAYGLPLAGLLGGAVLGNLASEPGALIGAACGLGFAWGFARRRMARHAASGKTFIEPYIANIMFQEENT
ncbi:MAG: SoxR reducing system RseC family protein [Zoogloeaceae bacterium]|jgi:sigma-E factor negative regulatory protein RseC|nr:SoxR reducing system RseC family protein [Zoogloeaceae bacterium]